MRRYIQALLIVVAATSAVACDENLSSIAGPDTPNLEPTFTSVQRDIFKTAEAGGRKACVTCHTANGRTPAAGLNLDVADPHAVLVNGKSLLNPGQTLVIPGDPNASYLVRKLEGGPAINGVRMPLGGPYLTAGQISIVRRWIELGAPKN